LRLLYRDGFGRIFVLDVHIPKLLVVLSQLIRQREEIRSHFSAFLHSMRAIFPSHFFCISALTQREPSFALATSAISDPFSAGAGLCAGPQRGVAALSVRDPSPPLLAVLLPAFCGCAPPPPRYFSLFCLLFVVARLCTFYVYFCVCVIDTSILCLCRCM
jgi:hypothetical protein